MSTKLVVITIYLIVIFSFIIFIAIKAKRQRKKIAQEIKDLEKQKNLILSAPILNELNKVEALVDAGAKVCGMKRPIRAPGLRGFQTRTDESETLPRRYGRKA